MNLIKSTFNNGVSYLQQFEECKKISFDITKVSNFSKLINYFRQYNYEYSFCDYKRKYVKISFKSFENAENFNVFNSLFKINPTHSVLINLFHETNHLIDPSIYDNFSNKFFSRSNYLSVNSSDSISFLAKEFKVLFHELQADLGACLFLKKYLIEKNEYNEQEYENTIKNFLILRKKELDNFSDDKIIAFNHCTTLGLNIILEKHKNLNLENDNIIQIRDKIVNESFSKLIYGFSKSSRSNQSIISYIYSEDNNLIDDLNKTISAEWIKNFEDKIGKIKKQNNSVKEILFCLFKDEIPNIKNFKEHIIKNILKVKSEGKIQNKNNSFYINN